MNEKQPDINPASDPEESQNSPINELDNETGHSQTPEYIRPEHGLLEEQPEPSHSAEVDAGKTGLSGLKKVIAKARLANTERQLTRTEHALRTAKEKPGKYDSKSAHKLSGLESWRSEARKARKGRLGARRMGLITNYGEKDGGRLVLDRTTIPDETTYFSAQHKLKRLERPINNIMTHEPTIESRHEALTERRDALREQLGHKKETAGKPETQEPVTFYGQYAKVLELAKTTKTLHPHDIVSELDDSFVSNPMKMRVLLTKLESDGIINEDGDILKSAEEIDAMMATPGQERAEKKSFVTDPIVGHKDHIGTDPAIGRRSETVSNSALLKEFGITPDDIAELSNFVNEQLKKVTKERTEETGQRLTEAERAELESDTRDEIVRQAFADDTEEEAIQATKQAIGILQRGTRSSGRRPGKRDMA